MCAPGAFATRRLVTRWAIASTTALLLLLTAGQAAAQPLASVAIGDRVRVSRPGPTIGTLVSAGDGTLVVRREDGVSVSIARTASTRLAISDGPGPCDGGARVACVLGGAVAGGLLVFTPLSALERPTSDLPSPVIYVGTPVGALVGALVGAKVGGERWRSVALPVRFSVTPAVIGPSHAADVRFSIAF